MKREHKKLHLSNEGFSLMELVVTMLVSAVVTAAVAGFLSIGMRYYQTADDEARLQTESQVAELFLTELLQEADEFNVIAPGACPPDVSCAFTTTRRVDPTDPTKDVFAVVVLRGTQLLYGEVADGSDAAKVSELMGKSISETFLANHVVYMNVSPTNRTDAMTNNGLVMLTVDFQVHGRAYQGNSTIALRNKTKN